MQSRICELQARLNAGEDSQTELDSLIPIIILYASHSTTINNENVWLFKLHEDDVLCAKHLIDLGSIIRDIVFRNSSEKLLFRLMQYSLPYVKHNRLSFLFRDGDDVEIYPELLKIVLCTCLGLFRVHSKKPVWNVRVHLYCLFDFMMSQLDSQSQFSFLQANMALLRLSLIEYFVYFSQKNMPVETAVFQHVFGLKAKYTEVFQSFLVIADTFRQHALQSEILNWKLILHHANIAIEKCNRICKGKTRIAQKRERNILPCHEISTSMIDLFLKSPKVNDIKLLRFFNPNANVYDLHQVMILHNCIQRYKLPCNFRQQQCKVVLSMFKMNSQSTLNSMFIHVCIKCFKITSNIKNAMRVVNNSTFCCSECKTDCSVIKINVVGSIVKVCDSFFFFCTLCKKIHQWQNNGFEMHKCLHYENSLKSKPRIRSCALCCKSMNLTQLRVLDENLGVNQYILLCAKHYPQAHNINLVYNFQSLKEVIACKLGAF